MDKDKDSQGTIGEENYKLLLEKLKEYDSKIQALERSNADIVAMNRELLSTTESKAPAQTSADRHSELEKKLKEGLKNA